MAFALSLTVLLGAGAIPSGAEVRVAPPSSWIDPLVADLDAPVSPGTSGGIDYLLVDDQVKTGPDEVEVFHHTVKRLLSPKGVENGSEVRIEFDPSYQRLTFHEVTIRRGKARLNALRREDVTLAQRERELDRRLFDGRVTAVLFLRDVRQGDVIEASWTVRGANPVFGPRWAGTFSLAFSVPVGQLGVRILSPASRSLAHRVFSIELAPRRSSRGDWVDYRWSRNAVEAIDEEGDLPPGAVLFPFLEVSEWADWAEVEAWMSPLYAASSLSTDARSAVSRWQRLPDDLARAQAALRFVQNEIRYLGFESGINSHRPHAPKEVLARGFGDCKDKSLLLVSLLRAMAIDAAPALVNTEERETVESHLPSPLNFDHVIVRVEVGGRVFWVDPTRSLERAPLGELEPPPFRRALVPDRPGLTEMPSPGPALLEVLTTYRIPRFQAPIELEVVSTFSGGRAVAMRHKLAEGTLASLQRRYLEYYIQNDPKITVAAPIEVSDSEEADRVVVREHYQVPGVLAGEAHDFEADSIRGALDLPRSTPRRLPMRVWHPVLIRERFRVDLPGPSDLEDEERSVAVEAARLTRRTSHEGNSSLVDFEYRSLQPSVPAAAVPRHLEAIRDMRRLTGFLLHLSVRGDRERARPPPDWTVVVYAIAFLISGASVVIGMIAWSNGDLRRWRDALRNWSRRRTFRAKFRVAAGDGPSAPISVKTADEVSAALSRLKCECGAALSSAKEAAEPVHYDGRRLLAHRLVCGRCGTSRQAYVAVED